ncbi:MAG: cell division protein ZapE [Pseudomonadota bacterium]
MQPPAPLLPPHQRVATRYEALVRAGDIDDDAIQRRAADLLDRLNAELSEQRLARKSSALGWLFAKRRGEAPVTKGLYLWGGVGRGKTMLMDLFFDVAPLKRKRRAHFHAFMTDVHDRIHAHRQALKEGKTKLDDPIPPVATQLANEARLLCFDEFHVVDIADAMILGRLFTQLFQRGVVLVATSNVMPANLYKDGLNRALFMPFVELLHRHVDSFELDSHRDYRLDKLAAAPTWYNPLGPVSDHAMDAAWERLTGAAPGQQDTIAVKGRIVPVPKQAQGVARFVFADLCEKPLGAEDYLAIAHRFHTVMIDGIPMMRAENRNEAKRFITLIDALYDVGVKLIASADAEPHALYDANSGNEAFAFDRTASRLIDMRSEEYLRAPRRAKANAQAA